MEISNISVVQRRTSCFIFCHLGTPSFTNIFRPKSTPYLLKLPFVLILWNHPPQLNDRYKLYVLFGSAARLRIFMFESTGKFRNYSQKKPFCCRSCRYSLLSFKV